MKTPTMTQSYKAELRVLKRDGRRDRRQTTRDLVAINREIEKLNKQRARIEVGLLKRGDQRQRRISILEGRIHS